jgi:hypothetical protein
MDSAHCCICVVGVGAELAFWEGGVEASWRRHSEGREGEERGEGVLDRIWT